MFFVIFQALFYFLPAYISNAMPVLLAQLKLFERLNVPVDMGKTYRGQRVFGATKTVRGVVGGTAGGIITILVQSSLFYFVPVFKGWFLLPYTLPDILILGFLLGIGEGLGDLMKSFIKRQMGMPSSAPAFLLDQSSFLAAVALSYTYFNLPAYHLAAILIISPIIPLTANVVAYKTGWKKVWW